MDVVPPPPAEKSDATAEQPTNAEAPKDAKGETKKDQKPVAPAPPKPPKQRGDNVGMAITATVVIILALAALATYAFIQTKK